MWKLRAENKGSITIEMCFVMPIIIGIIMILISIILSGLNEGEALGKSQLTVYQYSPEYSVEEGMDIVEENNSITSKGCTREWDVCTDRLRRWQLYGDVLCE